MRARTLSPIPMARKRFGSASWKHIIEEHIMAIRIPAVLQASSTSNAHPTLPHVQDTSACQNMILKATSRRRTGLKVENTQTDHTAIKEADITPQYTSA